MRPAVPHNGSPIQVIDRAVTLLDELAADSRPKSLAALSAASGLSKTTARRVLASLEQHGFCERTTAGYRLGLRLFELGTLVRERLDLRERSTPALEWLAETTHLTVFLCVREDDRAICIERIDGRFAHTLALRLGGTLPLHTGAAPLVLLAYSSDDEVERYLAASFGQLQGFTSRTMTSPEAVREAVYECRARGFVVSNQDVTDGVAAIGAPVFDHMGAVAAAVSLSGLTPHVLGDNQPRIVDAVCTAAARTSKELGFSGEVTYSRSDPQQRANTESDIGVS
jgi:DNA-binding IclR family transcriptional regulator